MNTETLPKKDPYSALRFKDFRFFLTTKILLTMALQIQAGHIWVNEQQIVVPESGWGGFKQSGIGRELGADGLSAYQKSKHVLLPL